MDPQDGKSSRLCKSACEESHDQQRFKRFVCVVSPQRIVKKSRPYSSPSTSKQSKETESSRGGGGGVLPYIRYIGMCRPKGYGF